MRPIDWWKNFGLGHEVEISGSFIYNGIKILDTAEVLNHPDEIFEILYNLSVGIERLLKVAIILLEHNDSVKIEELEESLITHNCQELAERLNKNSDLNLKDINREFLSLLSRFYKSHRYARYSLSSIPNIAEEKKQFIEFLNKHLKLSFKLDDEFFAFNNTDQIKKFVGKVVKRITDSVFGVIKTQTSKLNIYTDELRGDSKALRVFYGERLDFIDESIKKKEILLYLMNTKTKGDHIDLLREYGSLELDPEMAPYYIKALLNDIHLPSVAGEIDELYTDVKNVGERIKFLKVIDNDLYIGFDDQPD